MFEIDHIAVWTRDRDSALARLSFATGLPVLEGYAPGGQRVARGVRFSNGPFIDVHQAQGEAPPLLGLRGGIDAAEDLAARQGWWVRAERPPDEPDASPWSLLSFRRGQGLLSSMFVIDYVQAPEAWSSPIFNGGLYHLPAGAGPALRRVWLAAANLTEAGRALEALGFTPGGEMRSPVAPYTGRTYHGGRADIVLSGGEDGVVRFDLEGDGPQQVIEISSRVTAVVGDSAPESQQG